ncbi:MAG: DUF11 domain-containing protein, partial [bacterium]
MLLAVISLVSNARAQTTGMAVWRHGSADKPRYEEWNGVAFTGNHDAASTGVWRVTDGAEAPTRSENIVIGVGDDGVITAQIWDGSGWAAIPDNPLDTVTQTYWWSCQVAYESQSGDAVLVWANGSAGGSGISYLVWDGSDWDGPNDIDCPPDVVRQLSLASNPLADEMVLAGSTANSLDFAVVWNGESWDPHEPLDSGPSSDAKTDVYAAYEQQSGHAIVTYGASSTTVFTEIWNGSAWSIGPSRSKPADAFGDVRWTTLGADPNSDRIALGVLTSSTDVWLCVWNGSGWDTPATATTSASGTTHPAVAVAFESDSGEALATYGEGVNIFRYRTWSEGGGWTNEQIGEDLGSPSNSMILASDPVSDQIILAVQEDGSDYHAVLWDGGGWGAPEELENDTGETKNQPFEYVWDLLLVDLAVSTGVDMATANEGNTVQLTVSVTNNGPDGATGVELTDVLPPELEIIAASPTQGAYDEGTGVWTVGSLAASGMAAVTISARVAYGSGGSSLTNTASVTGVGQEDSDPGNDSDSSIIAVNTPPLHMQFASGQYNGSGIDGLNINAVGFQPDVVIIKGDVNKTAYIRTATLAGDLSKKMKDNAFPEANVVQTFTANGFVLGDHDAVNLPGVTYTWMAFQAAPGEMRIDTYIGNKTDDTSIEGIGFEPAYLIVFSGGDKLCLQRFAGMATDDCSNFENDGLVHNRIQDFAADGFQIGDDDEINENGTRFHYVAWKLNASQVRVGSYLGNGIDGFGVTGFGYAPQYVIIKSEEGKPGVHRAEAIGAGDETQHFEDTINFVNGIQQLDTDGIVLGNDDTVNKADDRYHYAAFATRTDPDLQLGKIVDDPTPDEGGTVVFSL